MAACCSLVAFVNIVIKAIITIIVMCICLRTEVGFGLRKDDPATLRQLLIDVHSKSSDVDVTAFTDPCVLFLLTLLLLRSFV